MGGRCAKRNIVRALLIGVFAAPLSALSAMAEERFALVIGNAGYTGKPLPALGNPLNDAKLMSDRLTTAGFDVTTVTDADLRGFKTAVREFTGRLAEAGEDVTALFFYAGHGLQGGGKNYLIPLGAELETEADLEFEAVATDWVLARLEAAHGGANVLLLDACRNPGLARAMGGGGLAPIQAAPAGSFISFATAPGMVAYDGNGENSYYTEAVASHMLAPGVDIEHVFKAVRRAGMADARFAGAAG